jgi:hypothetical protein
MTAAEILLTLTQHSDALKHFGVTRLGLFGSFSRDTAHGDSDLDFLVVLQPKTLDNYLGVKFFLEDTFNRPVDLVLEHTLRRELQSNVLRDIEYFAGL